MHVISKLASLAVPLALVLGAGCTETDASVAASMQGQRSTAVLPLREISGLARMGERFVAVGDRTTAVVSFALKKGEVVDIREHEPLPKAGKKGSQYEAVDVDGAGRVVVLSEKGDVVVLSSDLSKEEASAVLDWDSVTKLVDSRLDENSLGEGMVLLDSGHMLVALEKAPSAIVEFGPRGDAPIGFAPGTRSTTAFAPPDKLVALKIWPIEDERVPDVSDLEIGPDGALWAVSQQGNTLIRFERLLRPDEGKASGRDYLELPAQISGAEGLAFDGWNPVVARDRPGANKTNLYVLDAVSPTEAPPDGGK